VNFLAHVYLSRDDFEVALGNLIADQVKGKQIQHYPLKIQKGIQLHRSIDHFTDNHPLFRASVSALFPEYRHYSRVIVDLYFDHFLAANWGAHHSQTLEEFSFEFYQNIQAYAVDLPDPINHFLGALVKYNWFEYYQTVEGLKAIMTQMDKRTRFDSNLADSATQLVEKYSYFQSQFLKFMPQVISFSKQKLEQL
jgi:acyl carrier protein phosphodiesterase